MERNIKELTSMGYTHNQAKQALKVSQGDLGQAVSFLLMGDSSRMGFCFDPSTITTTTEEDGYVMSPVMMRSPKQKFSHKHGPDDDDVDDAMAKMQEQLSFASLVGDDDFNKNGPIPPAPPATTMTHSNESIQSLVQMGYHAEDAEIALEDCGGDINQAIERLLMQGSVRFSGIFSALSPLVAPKASIQKKNAPFCTMAATSLPLQDQEDDQDQDQDYLLYTAEALHINGEDAALAFALQEQELLEQEIQVQQQQLQQQQQQSKTKNPTSLGSEDEDALLAMALHQEEQNYHYHHQQHHQQAAGSSSTSTGSSTQPPPPPIRHHRQSSLQPVAGNPNLPRMVAGTTSIFSVPVPERLRESISVFCAVVAASKFYQGGMVNSDFLTSIITEGIAFGNRIVVVNDNDVAGPARMVTHHQQQRQHDEDEEAWSVSRVLSTTGTSSTWGLAMRTMEDATATAAVLENPKWGMFIPSDLSHFQGLRKGLATCRNEQEGKKWQIVILEIILDGGSSSSSSTTTTTTGTHRDCVTICLPPKGTMNKFWCLDIQPRPCFRAPPGAYARAHTNMMQLVDSLEGILKCLSRRGNTNDRGGAAAVAVAPAGNIQGIPFFLYTLQKLVGDKRKKPPTGSSGTVPPIDLRGVLC